MNDLKIKFISCLIKIQNATLLLLQKIIWRSSPSQVENIIVYKNGNIGDIVTAYPTIELIRLKYPHSKIVFLTSPGKENLISAASLLESQGLVDKVLYYYDGKILSLFRQIRNEKFDICFMMSDDRSVFLKELRNLLFFSLLNIKYLYGFSVNRVKFWENSFAQKIPYPYKNEVERNIDAANLGEYQITNLFKYEYIDISDKIFHVTKNINNALVIATGAKLKSKQWDKNNFFQIAKLWLQNKGDILFIGSKKDSEDVDLIMNKLEDWKMRTKLIFKSNNSLNLCGQTTLEETILLIDKSNVMVANDSGPAHLSSFTNTKVITIQAPRDFKLKWDPYLSKKFVFRPSNTAVCPCSVESCNYCINNIIHSDVWNKLKGFA